MNEKLCKSPEFLISSLQISWFLLGVWMSSFKRREIPPKCQDETWLTNICSLPLASVGGVGRTQ